MTSLWPRTVLGSTRANQTCVAAARVRAPGNLLRHFALAAMLCPLLAGCKTLSRQGPLPASVASCRQLSRQGLTAKEHGQWDKAEELLGRAVDACPVDVDARRHYGETLWHRGAAQAAITQLEEARKLSPDDPALAVRCGELYLAAGKSDQAKVAVDLALGLDSKAAAGWALRGRILQTEGHTREALADYQRALGYSPGDRQVLLDVAEAYRLLNQPERALAALQSLSDTYPPGEEPQQVLHLQGLALTALGRYSAAVEAYSLATQRPQPTAEILYRLAEAELLCGRRASAQAAVAQALALDPRHVASRSLYDRMQTAEAGADGVVRR